MSTMVIFRSFVEYIGPGAKYKDEPTTAGGIKRSCMLMLVVIVVEIVEKAGDTVSCPGGGGLGGGGLGGGGLGGGNGGGGGGLGGGLGGGGELGGGGKGEGGLGIGGGGGLIMRT